MCGVFVVGVFVCVCGMFVVLVNCLYLVLIFLWVIGVGDVDGVGVCGVNVVFVCFGVVWGCDDFDYVYMLFECDLLCFYEDDDEIEDEIDEIDVDAKDGKVVEYILID